MAEANPSSKDNTYRILLVGKTGSGKSATGNTLLGAKKFLTKLSLASETYECQLEQTENTSYTLEVMDCPGLFDTKTPNKVVMGLILKAVGGMHPGPNAIVYALKVGDRYTEEEYSTFQRLKEALGPEVVDYMIVAFTHGDQLAMEETTIDKYVNDGIKANKKFEQVLGQCGNRYVEFNNTPDGPKGQQVEILIAKINDMVRSYTNRTFKNKKFEIVEMEIEGEVRRLVRTDRTGQSQSGMTTSAAGQQQRSEDTLPLLDAANNESDTSTQDSDIIRFQLRREIAEGHGFFYTFTVCTEFLVEMGCAVTTGAAVGAQVGLVGAPVGAAIGAVAGGIYLGVRHSRRERLRDHLRQLSDIWEERSRDTSAGDNAQNTERAT